MTRAKRFASQARRRILRKANERTCRAEDQSWTGQMPSFIVVTPHLTHLAPLATRNAPDGVQPVFVANGITHADEDWLSQHAPGVPILRFRTSLTGNEDSMLEHGEVIDALAAATGRPFCIQDADCFVTDAAFWETVALNAETEYAAGPFVRRYAESDQTFPETFFLCLNGQVLQDYQTRLGLSAVCAERPGGRTADALAEAGYPEGQVLEPQKPYYDTLQQFWVLAEHDGLRFRTLAGENEAVHHIGGTSYLHRSFEDLAHWDFWPLNVHYVHLRLLEQPACAPFQSRFSALFATHGSAAALLESYPDYASGWRRSHVEEMMAALSADALYGEGVA